MVDIIPQEQEGSRCVTYFFYRFCTFFVVVFSDFVDGDGDDEKDGGTLSREDSGGFVRPKKKKAKLQPRGKGVQWGPAPVFKDTKTFLASDLGKELTDRFSLHKTDPLKKTNGKFRIST